MRILLTGGFGLIGGRLGQHLQRAGHQVVLGSRQERNAPQWLAQAEVARCDWNDGNALTRLCGGVDAVIHAAGMNAQDCAADPVAALEFNGLASARLVAAACEAGVKRFIHLSTAHVYASLLVGEITEDTCPRNLHPYATSHLAGEHAVLNANQRGQIEGIVLRLSNAFGVPVHRDVNCWMLLVNDLCRQAVQTGRLVLNSNGLQQRDFIALEDVARAVGHLLGLTREQCGLFNLGGDTSLSIWEMTQRVAERCEVTLGFSPEIVRPDPGADERAPALQYRCKKIQGTGFYAMGYLEQEIDNTLILCSRVWGAARL